MRILFDQGTPAPLRHALEDHSVATAFEMGWSQLTNGDLLLAAEAAFDGLITTDRNLRYQQNLRNRRLAILVLPTTSWPVIQRNLDRVVAAVNTLKPGDFVELPDMK
jgi:hypothetical protein